MIGTYQPTMSDMEYDTTCTITSTFSESVFEDEFIEVKKSLTELSLEKLRESMFVKRKIELNKIYRSKLVNNRIRNALPQRIRIDEIANN